MKKIFWILLLLTSSLLLKATHQVGGYFLVKWISGTTYRITLYDYTNTCNTEADRDTVRFYWGDGPPSTSYTIVPRRNGPIINGYHNGEPICDCRKLSIYDTIHTFPGPGSYRIWMHDQNRMANILNMSNSVAEDYFIFTTITLNPFAGYNFTSPTITYPMVCIYTCPNHCYYYNLGAYSPTGDSISYALGRSLSYPGITSGGYFVPPGTTLDPSTGTLTWCSPPVPVNPPGIYNFVILVITHKKFQIGNRYVYATVDTTECEFEVFVDGDCHLSDSITGINDTCVVAGDILKLKYTGSDPNSEPVTMKASGDPFTVTPPATYTTTGSNPAFLNFSWNTNCSEVRRPPYHLLVTASIVDTGNNTLNTYKNTDIFIVGPAPTNLTATPIGNAVQLNWNQSPCSNATGYQIYRHTGCYHWVHGPCETGVPSYTGYTLIGTTNCLACTSFLDNNGGRGLAPGVYYDYMVVASYPLPDGSLSYASNDTCVKLRRDMPVIINVSVTHTDVTHGSMFVRWTKPLADPTDFDTIANPGPYRYELFRATGMNGNSFAPVVTYTAPYFRSPIDTAIIDTPLNTQNFAYNYKVLFYSNNNLFDSSADASSIFLAIKPDNNKLHLSWQSSVPWSDSSYSIYRTFPTPVKFIATVPGTQHTYTDSVLTNLKTFCYYVESKSFYSDSTLPRPLFDSSEIMCGTPKDTIPPCAPKLAVNAVCDEYRDSLTWNNPDYTCPALDNRALYYKVYFSPTTGTDLVPIAVIHDLKDTIYLKDSLYSIAGCFAVTVVDSFNNESPLDTICVDNCPEYVLPNIFTPNGDGINDLFTPILPYRFIKDIDIAILNRWGEMVYQTIDPMIRWDGKDRNTHADCSDGVYYYVCTVHEIHIDGIKSRVLKGFVQLLR